jgi:arabinofuranan 3-O-arabinosyltransferase
VVLPDAVSIDSLPLTLVADGYHSVPTEIELWVDGEPEAQIPLPEIADGTERNATVDVDLDIPEITGSRFRVKLTGVRETLTADWLTADEVAQPAAVAEIGLPGDRVPDLDRTFDTGCRNDLLEIDGEPASIQVTGPMEDALAAKPLHVQTCDGADVTLDGGEHEIRSVRGLDSGIDLDQIVLRSAPGGGATSADEIPLVSEAGAGADGSAGSTSAGIDEPPTVEVLDEGFYQVDLEISGASPDTPFWLVLGQSYNDGWTAEGATHPEPRLVNGFANGWLVIPTEESFQVHLEFAPQQRVNWALGLSLIAGLGSVLLLIRRPRRVIMAPSAMPEPYSLVLAFRYHGALPTRPVAWFAGVAVGVAAWLVAGPIVGPIVGVAAGVAARHETFRRWLLLASPLALTLAAAYVVYVQMRHAPQATFDWPMELRRPHPVAWLAVWLMVADVIVGRIWQSRSSELEE